MRYRTKNEMKDSGIEWIGKIPDDWDINKFKYSTILINKTIENSDFSIALENIQSWTGKYNTTDTEYDSSGTKFNKGDILFGKLRPYLAKVYLANQSGKAIGDIYVFRGKKYLPGYLFYLIDSHNFINIVNSSTYGSRMPRASWDFIGNLETTLPPLSEQQAIAHYLDRKTEAVDALIEKKEQLIEKLNEKRQALITRAVTKGLHPDVPMKDSGIEWLGEIPGHWEVWKASHAFKKIGSGTTPKSDNLEYYDGDILWITTSELRENEIYDTKSKLSSKAIHDFSSLDIYDKNSVIIAMYGATIGRLGIMKEKATVNQACCVFSDSQKIDYKFFYYWIYSARPIIISHSYGGGQPNINQEYLKSLHIPVPNMSEQKEIVKYIDNKTESMDFLIQKNDYLISKLKEYRQSLISAAVTGKIDVREEVSA